MFISHIVHTFFLHFVCFVGVLVSNGRSEITSTGWASFIQIESAKIVPADENGVSQNVSSGQNVDNVNDENQRTSQRNRKHGVVPLKRKLEDASEASKKLRFRITALTTMFAGILMGISALGTFIFPDLAGFFWGLLAVGSASLALTLMTNDILLVRVVVFFGAHFIFIVGVCLAFYGFYFWFVLQYQTSDQMVDDATPPCSLDGPVAGCAVASVGTLIGGVNCMICGYYVRTNVIKVPGATFYDRSKMPGFRFNDHAFTTTSRQSLNLTWKYYRWYCAIDGARTLIYLAILHSIADRAPHYTPQLLHSKLGDVFGKFLVAFVIGAQRHRLVSFLASMTTKTETREAAIIAALLGNANPTACLEIAQQKFRSIPFEELRQDDFTRNTETAGETNVLFSKTSPCELGSCDAFLSHSWKDHGPHKFAALSQWAEQFKEQEGRYPSIWLDKACIDQQDISNDLLCLPIFLAGCDTLLIIAGRTYAQRLWCIMEVFVFLKMGGDIHRITILRIDAGDEDEKHEEYEANDLFDKVDVSKCECFLEKDRQRLMGIIEQGFGEFDDFNDIVQQVFKERVVNRQEMSENEKRLHRELKDMRKQFQAVLNVTPAKKNK